MSFYANGVPTTKGNVGLKFCGKFDSYINMIRVGNITRLMSFFFSDADIETRLYSVIVVFECLRHRKD